MSVRRTRLLKEISDLKQERNQTCFKFLNDFDENGSIEMLFFELFGPEGSRFASESLKLEMKITTRYPFEPPIVRFLTKVEHPNIDEATGRICLDLLRMPPEGNWRPNVSLCTVLVSIQVLLGEPNLEDPVRPDLISSWNKEKENNNVVDVLNDDLFSSKEPPVNKRTSTSNFNLSLAALKKKSKTE